MKLTLKLTPYNFAYLVYPVVYVCSIPLTLLLKRYNGTIAHTFPVNFIELYIVSNHGYMWFTGLYWILAITLGYLPTKDTVILTRYTKIYLINTLWILILLEWFLDLQFLKESVCLLEQHVLSRVYLGNTSVKTMVVNGMIHLIVQVIIHFNFE